MGFGQDLEDLFGIFIRIWRISFSRIFSRISLGFLRTFIWILLGFSGSSLKSGLRSFKDPGSL